MKIAVLIVSRNNPQGLETVISSLSLLDSGAHAIRYCVGYDHDDEMTPGTLKRLKGYGMDVTPFPGPRPLFLGQPYNDMANSITDCDAFCTVSDRFIPLTQFWDQAVAMAVEKKNKGVFWWNSHMPGGTMTFPALAAPWVRAAGGIYTARCFPFWFDDTWLAELHALVFGLPHLVLPCYFANVRKHPTKRLRDMRFWMDVYIAKQPERIAHAEAIARTLGMERPPMDKVFEEIRFREQFWKEHCHEWETAFGDASKAPDATYLAAKANAEAFMQKQSST